MQQLCRLSSQPGALRGDSITKKERGGRGGERGGERCAHTTNLIKRRRREIEKGKPAQKRLASIAGKGSGCGTKIYMVIIYIHVGERHMHTRAPMRQRHTCNEHTALTDGRLDRVVPSRSSYYNFGRYT